MTSRPGRRFGVAAAAVSALALLLSSIASPASAASTCTMNNAQAQQQILSEVNSARASYGLAALAPSAPMNDVATSWSSSQVASGKMSHNPYYSSQIPAGWTTAGENVAFNYAPTAVTSAWMNSDGHRANILNRSFTHIGIGMACDSSGRAYYTQNFAAYSTPQPAPAPVAPAPTPLPAPAPAPSPSPTPSVAPVTATQPAPNPAAGFAVSAHVQAIGWMDGNGTTGRGLRLEALRLTQTGTSQTICVRPHVAAIGWMAAQCTTGQGSTITVGTTGRGLALEALEIWSPGNEVWAQAHVQAIGWQGVNRSTAAGSHIIIGTTGRGLRLEAARLWP